MEDDIVWIAEEMAFQKYTESRDADIVKGKVFYCSLQKKKKKEAVCNMQALKAEPKITVIHRPSGHRVSTLWNIEDINTTIPAWARQNAERYTGNIKTAPSILLFKVKWQIKSVLKALGFVWKENKT